MKKKINLKDLLMLQLVFLVYSGSSVVMKFASNYDFLSVPYILLMGGVVLALGIYAILWQQVIKRFELSVAYANKAITLLWALLWGIFIFDEDITKEKVLGIIIVMIGIYVLNSEKENTEPETESAKESTE